ncbi:MAG: hypothetical protein ACPGU7_14880 [Gammaproteobacteria bacterium]
MGVRIRKTCDVVQGFDFQRECNNAVGHITALTVSGTRFENDLSVYNPTKADSGPTEKVVAVIKAISWNGGYYDPITFSCQFTDKNREAAAELTKTKTSNEEVELAFNIYDQDTQTSPPEYYRLFHTNGKIIKGAIEKVSGALELEIESEPSQEVWSPRNFLFYLSVMPTDVATYELHLGLSRTAKFVRKWGFASND